ncbi:MAG: sirohydrochlorin chelatase, partial [Thauera sp.]|nr:sirohydrochlorin chelatase [Thauera sp.]
VTWPRLETVVQRQARLGMTQVCIVPAYLFTGVLMERIHAQVERLQHQYPQVAFALGTHFGFDEGIFNLLDARVAEGCAGLADAAAAHGLLECDGCRYRLAAEDEHLHDHSHTACHHSHPDVDHTHDADHGCTAGHGGSHPHSAHV